MSYIIADKDGDPSKWSPSKKFCEFESIFWDLKIKHHAAGFRSRWFVDELADKMGDLPYSFVKAFEDDQTAKASKLREEIAALKEKHDEIKKQLFDENQAEKWTFSFTKYVTKSSFACK